MGNRKNYHFSSKLEESGTYRGAKQYVGYGQEELREHFNMVKRVLKPRICLKCERNFEHESDRVCHRCKGQRRPG